MALQERGLIEPTLSRNAISLCTTPVQGDKATICNIILLLGNVSFHPNFPSFHSAYSTIPTTLQLTHQALPRPSFPLPIPPSSPSFKPMFFQNVLNHILIGRLITTPAPSQTKSGPCPVETFQQPGNPAADPRLQDGTHVMYGVDPGDTYCVCSHLANRILSRLPSRAG